MRVGDDKRREVLFNTGNALDNYVNFASYILLLDVEGKGELARLFRAYYHGERDNLSVAQWVTRCMYCSLLLDLEER